MKGEQRILYGNSERCPSHGSFVFSSAEPTTATVLPQTFILVLHPAVRVTCALILPPEA